MRKGLHTGLNLNSIIQMATIKDVAKRAGVSITTVSHVINKTRYVSDELLNSVNKAMEELDYHPNILARGLRRGETKTIGLVIPDISNQFFAEISRKIEDKGFEHGYSVIMCNTDDDYLKEKSYIDVLIAKHVDGIIFISAGVVSDTFERTIELKIPIVVADRDIRTNNSDIVLVDNHLGGFEATKYLINLGHKRIGCIAGPSSVTPSAQRLEGYKSALKDAGLMIDTTLIIPGDFRYQSGDKAMQAMLSNPQRPTGVFACNDMMALGAIRAVHDRGFKIPDDISLIGFDNIPLSQTVYPSLTTMSQPLQEMAELVIDLLTKRIEFKNQRQKDKEELKFQRIVLEAKLIERDSCREI